ncbi:hypothetical protein [Streptomyces sp. T028]|uniref:hypothetical protein n=1 Tax=Streptomyces sp. T028 TaxID=3394379 RepID=UPI003A850047
MAAPHAPQLAVRAVDDVRRRVRTRAREEGPPRHRPVLGGREAVSGADTSWLCPAALESGQTRRAAGR